MTTINQDNIATSTPVDYFGRKYCSGYYCNESTRCQHHHNNDALPAAFWARRSGPLEADLIDVASMECMHFEALGEAA